MRPTLLPMKGVKNEVELAQDREAHLRDAVAMVRFQSWKSVWLPGKS